MRKETTIEFKPLKTQPEDSQFLALRKSFTDAIARALHFRQCMVDDCEHLVCIARKNEARSARG